MDIFQAIFKRKSVRKYASVKLSKEQLADVRCIIEGAERLYKDIDLRINLVEDGEKIYNIMSGLVGGFGKVKAPHFLLITSPRQQGYLENAGYAVEQVVLNLTTKGIATCWLGGHVKDEQVKTAIGMPEDQTVVVLVSVGQPLDKAELFRADPGAAKRKDVREFVEGDFDESWSDILKAVRIAPSAVNSQPWYFIKEGNLIHVICRNTGNFLMRRMLKKINFVDMGIGLCHFIVATRYFGKKVNIERVEGATIKEGIYVTSLRIDL